MTVVAQSVLTINGKEVQYRASSVYDMVTSLGTDLNRDGVAVAVNGEVILREEWKATTLKPGDQVEVVNAVAGG